MRRRAWGLGSFFNRFESLIISFAHVIILIPFQCLIISLCLNQQYLSGEEGGGEKLGRVGV